MEPEDDAVNVFPSSEFQLYPEESEYGGENDRNGRLVHILRPEESKDSKSTTTTTTGSTLGESEIFPSEYQHQYGFGYGFGLPQKPRDILTREMIQYGISFTGPVIGTTAIAYTKLEVRSKKLRDISLLSTYHHLRLVDLSDNAISNLEPLTQLKYLQVLNVEGNKIREITDIPHFQWLQALNVSRNEITSLFGFLPNYISYMNLSHNGLSSTEYLTGDIFPNLLLLELRGNFIANIREIELPKLRHLYIAKNLLTNLDGIQNCPSLELVHARQNKIRYLDHFPNLDKLKYVNLRGNRLTRFTQTVHLGNSPNLETIVLLQNKVQFSDRYRQELCAAILNLKRIDKIPVGEMELVEGRLLRTGRLKHLIDQLEDDEAVLSPSESIASAEEGDDEEEDFDA